MCNLKHDRNEPIYGTETGSLTENRLVVTRVGSWGGMECEIGVSRCKLSYVGWINNKVLLYSTWREAGTDPVSSSLRKRKGRRRALKAGQMRTGQGQ